MTVSSLAGRTASAPPYLTDSLRVRLPESAGAPSTCQLLQEFEKYGEVSRVELVDGHCFSDRNALVSYFDARAAEQARAALGDACTPAPSHGHRVLRLLGDASLESYHVDEVASIESTEDGDFLLEFFDVRVAAKVAATAYYAAGGSGKAATLSSLPALVATDSLSSLPPLAAVGAQAATLPSLPALAAEDAFASQGSDARSGDLPPCSDGAPEAQPAPKRGLAARMCTSQLNWDDLAAKRERRTALLLRGLPKALCDEAAFKALLSTKDMLRMVRRVKVPPTRGRSVGYVLVEASSVDDVPKVAKFFHGRQFGGGHSVAVSFAPAGQRGRDAPAPGPAAPRGGQTVRDAAEEHVRRRAAAEGLLEGCRKALSDATASTRESSSDFEPPPGLPVPFGLHMPPPGLELMGPPPGLAAPAAWVPAA